MLRTLLTGKIHRATVTGADLHYIGSISVDAALLEAAGILAHEQVQVVDITNGSRLETYAIPAPAGSGTIQLNGAAAHLVDVGDLVIVMAYAQFEDAEARAWRPRVVHVDRRNRVVDVAEGVVGGVYEAC